MDGLLREFIACLVKLDERPELNRSQNQEPADGENDAVFPIKTLWPKQPEVDLISLHYYL
jgi:hypothetical protein